MPQLEKKNKREEKEKMGDEIGVGQAFVNSWDECGRLLGGISVKVYRTYRGDFPELEQH